MGWGGERVKMTSREEKKKARWNARRAGYKKNESWRAFQGLKAFSVFILSLPPPQHQLARSLSRLFNCPISNQPNV